MPRRATTAAFTLVELIIVMALLAIAAALAAPMLSRSLRDRNLADEATRFLSASEYARNEAVSQGIPMVVWLNASAGRFGVGGKAGFEVDESRLKDFPISDDIHFEIEDKASTGQSVDLAEFSPDGAMASTSLESLRLLDRFGSAVAIARTADRWGYEILAEKR